MTEKRYDFEMDGNCYMCICDTIDKKVYTDKKQVVDLLNKLNDENEQLKQAYQKLKHRHSLLHDECLDIECERNSLKKDVESLEKENEELKQQIKELQE